MGVWLNYENCMVLLHFAFVWRNNMLVIKKTKQNKHLMSTLECLTEPNWTLQLHRAHVWRRIHPADGPRSLSWDLQCIWSMYIKQCSAHADD